MLTPLFLLRCSHNKAFDDYNNNTQELHILLHNNKRNNQPPSPPWSREPKSKVLRCRRPSRGRLAFWSKRRPRPCAKFHRGIAKCRPREVRSVGWYEEMAPTWWMTILVAMAMDDACQCPSLVVESALIRIKRTQAPLPLPCMRGEEMMMTAAAAVMTITMPTWATTRTKTTWPRVNLILPLEQPLADRTS